MSFSTDAVDAVDVLRGSSRDELDLYLGPYGHRCLVTSPVKAAATRLHLENLLFSRQNVSPRKKAEFVALSFDSDLTVTHRCACSTLDECCVFWKQ